MLSVISLSSRLTQCRILSPILKLEAPRPISTQNIRLPAVHRWNRAVAEAEDLVGFPTSLVSLRTLMNDDVTSMASHMRKLMGSGHPVLKALKRLLYNERNNLQVRGLMILLLARAFNSKAQIKNDPDLDAKTGILLKQRKLAEYVEMICSAQNIHRTVMNLPQGFHDHPSSEEKDDLLRLEYGNKIAILGGDYLLANACTGLASLRNTFIVEMISKAIADFSQAEFIGKRDIQGRFIPTASQISLESWVQRNTLAYGNLMANGARGVCMLAEHDEAIQEACNNVGFNLSLALQAFTEIQSFVKESGNVESELLDLGGAPVLFHLQNDPDLLKEIEDCGENIDNLNHSKIVKSVRSGPGIQMTQELCNTYASEAVKIIDSLPEESSKHALIKIVDFLRN